MAEKLCLKWNNHLNALEKMTKKHFMDEFYSDATILCEGNFYPVHRLILSTCSEYFETMFEQCRQINKHPFIVVKDVDSKNMERILNYMYKGEIHVYQEDLPELIKSAEAFRIKGLAIPDLENESPTYDAPSSPTKIESNSSCIESPTVPEYSDQPSHSFVREIETIFQLSLYFYCFFRLKMLKLNKKLFKMILN